MIRRASPTTVLNSRTTGEAEPPTAYCLLPTANRLLFSIFHLALLYFLLALAAPAAAAVSEEQVMDVAKELACLCGDCPNRPLDECRCGYAGNQRNQIASKFESGKTKDQVIAGFVAEFGERIFNTPPKKGFNLMAWFMPIFTLLVGGYAVRTIMKGWSHGSTSRQTQTPARLGQVTDSDRAKLDDALSERDA